MLFFCPDYHVFCTRLMRRRWVYILWRIYLWSCCNQVLFNMPQLKRIPILFQTLSLPLPHNTSSPHLPHHFSSSSIRPILLFLLYFSFAFLCHLSDLASLTLHTMEPACGKCNKTAITSLAARSCRSIYLVPPWELWLLTHLQLQQL